ncbi:hypothetical protein [Chryseobacterium sp. KLBC 52]|uniref:hypothetical protein n=1 Tax=Chryseobacterium sp. KLBC 52 TaxID=1862702 RepID=UPI001E43D46A|nr:hypothetical protein [Chryseobacterium sp. KLBC 52]
MKTTTLYRPVGEKEMILIIESGFKEFPPRLEWQPIFYPVLNEEYASEIAEKWNTRDEAGNYLGFVTQFDVLRSGNSISCSECGSKKSQRAMGSIRRTGEF